MSELCGIPDVQGNPDLFMALGAIDIALNKGSKAQIYPNELQALSAYITYLKQGVRSAKQTIEQILSRPAPPRDAYDLAEMITAKVQAGTWTAQAVADAIERLYEARDKAKALETRP